MNRLPAYKLRHYDPNCPCCREYDNQIQIQLLLTEKTTDMTKPEQFLKSYIRWAIDELDQRDTLISGQYFQEERIFKIEKCIFDSFLGQKAYEIYCQMNGFKVTLTNHNNIWYGDPIIPKLIEQVIEEDYDSIGN